MVGVTVKKLLCLLVFLSWVVMSCSPPLQSISRMSTTPVPETQPPPSPMVDASEGRPPSFQSGFSQEDAGLVDMVDPTPLESLDTPQPPETTEKPPLEIGEPDKGITFDIPIVMNDRVEYFIDYFARQHKRDFALWLQRSGKYVPMMKAILRENSLPEDLVYLAMIESGFNPRAYSHRKASGPWQFISGTGQRYGLIVNWWIDERRSPEKSTLAAAGHLKDLYDQFSCWYLAAAGYNAGAGKISRAIRQYRTEDFWELTRHRYLKTETKNYVPKMIAAALIAKEPEKYGFTDIVYDEPVRYETVSIPDATDLRVIARCAQVDYDLVRALNPELIRWCTPPHVPAYHVKIPEGTKEVFIENFSRLRPSERVTFRRHLVRTGETLSHIARHYGTRISPIMELNGISSPRRLRAGSHIIIPIPAHTESPSADSPSSVPPPTSLVATACGSERTEGPSEKFLYVVKEGDTLWNISKTYNLAVDDIKRWNGLRGNLIHPRDTLVLKIRKEETS